MAIGSFIKQRKLSRGSETKVPQQPPNCIYLCVYDVPMLCNSKARGCRDLWASKVTYHRGFKTKPTQQPTFWSMRMEITSRYDGVVCIYALSMLCDSRAGPSYPWLSTKLPGLEIKLTKHPTFLIQKNRKLQVGL